LHRDQEGTISVLSVFAMLLFTMLLGMVMNVGRHVDGKIRLQNAADAVAYSGGVMIARGMNALAFSNHLLCDVFALTAFMREARDRNAETCTPGVLAAWSQAARVLAGSGIPKFAALGQAIQQKVPQEELMVQTFSQWLAAASAQILPLLEMILSEEAIPEFQRAVVQAFPDLAQRAAMEVAERNGLPHFGRGPLRGVLWRTDPEHPVPVGGEGELLDSTLPAVDPTNPALPDSRYLDTARRQRRRLAHRYLNDWNNEALAAFRYYYPTHQYNTAWMCQFAAAWRNFTCGYLEHLLNVEYPNANLPHVIRAEVPPIGSTQACNDYLDRDFTFLGVAYWRELPALMGRVFRAPTESDSVAFAQVRVFVPRARLVWDYVIPGRFRLPIGGAPGDGFPPVDGIDGPEPPPSGEGHWVVRRQGVPTHWDLLNQHWTCQLVPATHPSLLAIIQTPPPLPEFADASIRLPRLVGLDSAQIGRISTH